VFETRISNPEFTGAPPTSKLSSPANSACGLLSSASRVWFFQAAPKVKRFITLGGEPYLIRYNSRLPVVVYALDGVEVRYRIWSAGAKVKPVEKG
jgi:hypothetical protein